MKKRIIVLSMIGLAAVALYYFFFLEENAMEQIIVKPSYGEFEIVVKTTGELRAQKSIEIRGPSEVQNLGIYNMKITNLVDEGTHVKEGDFVAELDKSDLTSKMKELDLNIQKLESQYKQKKLDSTITLSQARDNLENTKYSLEEKETSDGAVKI